MVKPWVFQSESDEFRIAISAAAVDHHCAAGAQCIENTLFRVIMREYESAAKADRTQPMVVG
jgi:hypothetical protein